MPEATPFPRDVIDDPCAAIFLSDDANGKPRCADGDRKMRGMRLSCSADFVFTV
jgi:hypothetical protein